MTVELADQKIEVKDFVVVDNIIYLIFDVSIGKKVYEVKWKFTEIEKLKERGLSANIDLKW